ncbi:hypothetical protein [Bradyrhizobium sp. USDA 4506]
MRETEACYKHDRKAPGFRRAGAMWRDFSKKTRPTHRDDALTPGAPKSGSPEEKREARDLPMIH